MASEANRAPSAVGEQTRMKLPERWEYAAWTHPPDDTGCAGVPSSSESNDMGLGACERRSTRTSLPGKASATQPDCRSSVGVACSNACAIVLPAASIGASPPRNIRRPPESTTGTPSTTVNAEADSLPPSLNDPVSLAPPLPCLIASTMPSLGRYPHTVPAWSTTILPPLPSRMLGASPMPATSPIRSMGPAYTLPLRRLSSATVPPPTSTVRSCSATACSATSNVEASMDEMPEAPVSSAWSPDCTMSKRPPFAVTAAVGSSISALNRIALPCAVDVTHTVPSSQCT